MFTGKISSERGYGLPATILLLVVFSVMGLAGLSLARQEVRSQMRERSREAAFYAAETGVLQGVESWSTPSGLVPKDSTWILDSGSLPGGATYRVFATKLDDDDGVHALYSIRSEGTAPGGQVQRVGLLVAIQPVEDPFNAALEVKDSAYLAGTASVEGFDHLPTSWNGPYCSALDDDKAGATLPDTSRYSQGGKKDRVFGDPPLAADPDTTNFFDFGDVTFDELAAGADHVLPDGDLIDVKKSVPSYTADGACDTNDPYNWGDPLNPGQPCSNWFPTIYVKGDLNIQSVNKGQGLLLVEGNLTADGGYEFYGPVIVKGDLIAAGSFRFYGGVKATNTDLGAGNAEIFYSSCVINRVLSRSKVGKPRPLTERPWFQNR